MPDVGKNSKLKFFADELLFHFVESLEDSVAIQQDLDNLVKGLMVGKYVSTQVNVKLHVCQLLDQTDILILMELH